MSSRLASLMIAYRISISPMGVSARSPWCGEHKAIPGGDEKRYSCGDTGDANLQAEPRILRRCHHAKK
jgi:hypothetical protein